MASNLFGDIEYLKGVGSARGEKYRKLGINSPYELIYHVPRSYLDFRAHVPVCQAPLGENSVLKLTIFRKMPPQRIRGGLVICKAAATDGIDDILIVVYNNVYYFQALKENETYYMYGKVTGNLLRREISSPVYIRADEKVLIQPIYRLTQGLSVNMVRTNMRQALNIMKESPFETLPAEIRKNYSLIPLAQALEDIHFPPSEEAAENARRRLAFDELLKLRLGMSLMKSHSRRETSYHMSADIDVGEFEKELPFEMTDDQKKAVSEIVGDLCRETPMNRLLQGDVGSGKTVVAAALIYTVVKNGYQCAFMAPTEILAQQHFRTCQNFFKDTNIHAELLTGSVTAANKRAIKERLKSGETRLIIGTHALIQDDVEFSALGLVITDEQHRFGVKHRAALSKKGDKPHTLVMSATPIPRTLALMLYGDLDVSVLDELPPGRQPIETYYVTGKLRARAFGYVKKHLDEGRQGYIVCPLVEEGDEDIAAAESYAENLSKGFFNGYEVGLLHGKMKSKQKDEVMSRFVSGEVKLLIATTVIEVGVDVPNAVIMVIENAERFGLSQLHQLRGRIGRGQYKSTCILISDAKTDSAKKRMEIMTKTTDGFKIADEDLKMRGPGDFFGARQHGLPNMKMASLTDSALLTEAHRFAQEILSDDLNLQKAENRNLNAAIYELFNSEYIMN